MTYNTSSSFRYYDLHGLCTFEVSNLGDPVADGLDQELSIFRVDQGKPDLSIAFNRFPSEEWVPKGASIDKNLFYDESSSATTILWSTKSVVKRRHVRYVFIGDIKKPQDKISVFIPSTSVSKKKRATFWRKIPEEISNRNWPQAALFALRRESFYKFEDIDNATNEVLMLVVQPYLYYRLPPRGYTFVHGSAVSTQDGLGAIFFGTSNVGKTRIAVEMAKQGMNFLGDDLTIVGRDGHGFSYPKRVRIEPQDILLYPRLLDLIRSNMDGRERFVFNTMQRYMRNKPLNVNIRVPISELMPNSKVRRDFKPSALIHAKRIIGGELALKELDRDSCVKLLAAELFWQFGTGGKQEYISCPSYAEGTFLDEEASHYSRVTEILSKVTDGVRSFELCLPTVFDVGQVGKMISKAISS